MNRTGTPHSTLKVLFRSLIAAVKSVFESGSNREFKRLKDFIAS